MADISSSEIDHHAEEDENYFVSMTDMMVGILFVFIILLMVFAMNFRQQTDTSLEQIELLKQVRDTAQKVQEEVRELQLKVQAEISAAAAASELTHELLETLKEQLAAEGLEVTIDYRSGVLRLSQDAINFDLNSADLHGRAAANVDKLAKVMSMVLPLYTPEKGKRPAYIETVFIEGHTDEQGLPERNWKLSTERAVNTFWRLVQREPYLGELRNRAGTPVLSAAGYASSRPIPGVSTFEYDRHRRIDLRFILDTDTSERLEEVIDLTNKMQQQLDKLQTAVEGAHVR
jgi:chemotaxis protein MotB